MSYQLSKQDILKEIVKAGKDPNYFINNYAKISHPMHGLIPFKLYDYQEELVKDFNDHRFNVILKARQLGISTISAAYISWMMLFHPAPSSYESCFVSVAQCSTPRRPAAGRLPATVS